MKRFLFLLFSLFLIFSAGAQENIREQIARVEVSLNETLKEQFLAESDRQEKRNDKARAEAYKLAAGDWSGSGFLYVHSSGVTYFITNRHVADFGQTTKVIFENRNEVFLETEDVRLLYLDDELDLAVYSLGESFAATHPRGFQFFTDEISDGAEVWAAGYPGLITKPVWQLSRGVVTNGWALVDELVDSKLSHLIQHSAPVDPGNSGGPLLILRGNQEYMVAGVNTWRVYDRANTFFAVPAATVLTVVEKAVLVESGLDRKTLEEQLEARAQKFLEAQNGPDYRSRDMFFISQDLVVRKGFDSYQAKLNQSAPSLRRRIEESFFFGARENTLREVLYLNLYEGMKKIRDKAEGEWRLESTSINGDGGSLRGTSRFVLGEESVELSWIFEKGNWKISEVATLNEGVSESAVQKKAANYNPSGIRISLDGGMSFAGGEIGGMPNFSLGIAYVYTNSKNTLGDYGFELGYYSLPGVIWSEGDPDILELRGFFAGVNIGWGLFWPGTTGEKLKLIPGLYFGGECGAHFASKYYDKGSVFPLNGGFIFDGIYAGGKLRFSLDFHQPEYRKITWGLYLEGQFNLIYSVININNANGDSAFLIYGVLNGGVTLSFN